MKIYNDTRQSEVVDYCINNGCISFVTTEGIITIIKEDNEFINLQSLNVVERILSFQKYIIGIDDLNNILLIYNNIESKLIQIPDVLNNCKIDFIEDDLIYTYQKTTPRKFGICNFEKEIFTTTLSLGNLIKINDKIYDYSSNSIRQFKNQNELNWQHDFSHLPPQNIWDDHRPEKVSKVLGEYNQLIFVLTESSRIVVLDALSGSLIKVMFSHDFPDMRDSFMHPEDHQIYCLSHKFVKIDTVILEIATIKEIASYTKETSAITLLYGIRSSSFQGKYITFTSFTSRRAGEAKWIGLFDYQKEDIVWHYELLEDEDGLYIPPRETPKLAKNKLYVLDSNRTLHILSKSEWYHE